MFAVLVAFSDLGVFGGPGFFGGGGGFTFAAFALAFAAAAKAFASAWAFASFAFFIFRKISKTHKQNTDTHNKSVPHTPPLTKVEPKHQSGATHIYIEFINILLIKSRIVDTKQKPTDRTSFILCWRIGAPVFTHPYAVALLALGKGVSSGLLAACLSIAALQHGGGRAGVCFAHVLSNMMQLPPTPPLSQECTVKQVFTMHTWTCMKPQLQLPLLDTSLLHTHDSTTQLHNSRVSKQTTWTKPHSFVFEIFLKR